MIEELEYKGVWWLPNQPKKQISGNLRFSPNKGAILDLFGSFSFSKNPRETQNFPIILGNTLDGRKFTLFNCLETERITHIPGAQTSSFLVGTTFKDVHFQEQKDIKFKSISVHYSYLDNWLGISGFDMSPSAKDEIIIKYNPPKPIKFNIGDYEISIDIHTTYPRYTTVQTEASIKQTSYITIKSPEEKSFYEYQNAMANIKNFLSLGVRGLLYPLDIKGITDINKKIIKDKELHLPIDISYKLPDIPEDREILPFQMLFTFKDVHDKFELLLKNWIEKTHLLKPTYDLYFGTLYNPHLYFESQFLSLTQALESYHQRTYVGKYLPEEDYKKIYNMLMNTIETALEGIKGSLKDRLKAYLKYGNVFSLRTRLKEILNSNEELINLFIRDKDKFINDVVETRNYLTHYDKDKEMPSPAESYEELFRLIQNLRTIIETCLLRESGFSPAEIKSFFSKNSYIMRSITQSPKFYRLG